MERIRVGVLGALAVAAVLAFFLAPSSGLFDRVAVMVLCAVLAIIWNLAVAGGPQQHAVVAAPHRRRARGGWRALPAAGGHSVADAAPAPTDGRPRSSDDPATVATAVPPRTSALTAAEVAVPAAAASAMWDENRVPSDGAASSVGGQRCPIGYPSRTLPDQQHDDAPARPYWSPRSTGPGYFDLDPGPPAPAAPMASTASAAPVEPVAPPAATPAAAVPESSSAGPPIMPIEATACPATPAGASRPAGRPPSRSAPTGSDRRPGPNVPGRPCCSGRRNQSTCHGCFSTMPPRRESDLSEDTVVPASDGGPAAPPEDAVGGSTARGWNRPCGCDHGAGCEQPSRLPLRSWQGPTVVLPATMVRATPRSSTSW